MDVEEEVRSRLNEICKERYGGTESEMARATGLKRPTLHNILSGKTKKIELKQIVAVVTKTGVSLDWLVLGRGPKFKTAQASNTEQAAPEEGRPKNHIQVPELLQFDKPKVGRVGEGESVEPGGVPGQAGSVLPGVTIRVAGQPSIFMDWHVTGRADRINVDIPLDVVAGRGNAR